MRAGIEPERDATDAGCLRQTNATTIATPQPAVPLRSAVGPAAQGRSLPLATKQLLLNTAAKLSPAALRLPYVASSAKLDQPL